MRSKQKKTYIIIGLCLLVLLMSVGYAAFSTVLNINGTAEITTSWDVEITNVQFVSKVGEANYQTPTYTYDTANLVSSFKFPGDSVKYKITVSNLGSVNAVIDSAKLELDDQNVLIHKIEDLEAREVLNAGADKEFYVTITFNEDTKSQPDISNVSATLKLNYLQAGNSTSFSDATSDVSDSITINSLNLTPSETSITAKITSSIPAYRYYYSLDEDVWYESSSDEYTINGLSPNKEYTVFVKAEDSSGEVVTKYGNTSTIDVTAPKIDINIGNHVLNEKNATTHAKYEYYNSLEFNVTVTDNDEVDDVKYCIGASNCTPTTSLTLTDNSATIQMPSASGEQFLCIKATDKITPTANEAVKCTKGYKVDGVAPTLTNAKLITDEGSVTVLLHDGNTETVGNQYYSETYSELTAYYRIIPSGNSSENIPNLPQASVPITNNNPAYANYTFTGLSDDDYQVQIIIKDKAGNEATITKDVSIMCTNSNLSDCIIERGGSKGNVTSAKSVITAKGTPNFTQLATTDEGMFKATDYDENDTYYFRGAVENNYVRFAGYYWRIIRVNGDGTVRMIYDGTSAHANGEASQDRQVGTSAFNKWYSDNAYVGYMYGTPDSLHNEITEASYTLDYTNLNATARYYFGTSYSFNESTNTFTLAGTLTQYTIAEYYASHNNEKLYTCFSASSTGRCQRLTRVKESTATSMTGWPVEWSSKTKEYAHSNVEDSKIKDYLENTWYPSNLNAYTSKLSGSTVFCNNRQMSIYYNSAYKNNDPNSSGFGIHPTLYGYPRFWAYSGSSISPTLACPQTDDRFTVDNSTGNGKQYAPIGLITADEVSMAGGKTDTQNTMYYLYTGHEYWTMSPSVFNHAANTVEMRVTASGMLASAQVVSNEYGVRPVININPNAAGLEYSGTGTRTDPYKIKSVPSSSQSLATNNTGTSGDGEFVEDPYESGRYIYRGANPDNYLTFNGETAGWRIVSLESDGTMKIVRNSNVTNMAWDSAGNRDSSTSTYCMNVSSYGCNAWAATSSILNTNGTNIGNTFTLYGPNGGITGTAYSGTVTQDSSLKMWLNEEYLNNPNNNSNYLVMDKKYIVNHNFYVSSPGTGDDVEIIGIDAEQEKLYKWNGKIGLIQATDYMKASTNTASCTSLSNAYNDGSNCGTGNYLKPSSGYYWTISPFVGSGRGGVWFVYSSGILSGNSAISSYGVRPSLYLSSSVKLKGEGTITKPYYIVS